MNLDDWLEWTDARGMSLSEAGFLQWLTRDRADIWEEGFNTCEAAYNQGDQMYSHEENPYREVQSE